MRHIFEADRVTATIKAMIACAKILDIPIIANTQYIKGLGPYVPELEEIMEGVVRPDKTTFSAYGDEGTLEVIKALPESINTAILVGVETHICVYQTAMGALANGLQPWVVSDGVSARSEKNHHFGLARMEGAGALTGPAEMLIYELLGKAGTAEFKAMLPHILEHSTRLS